MFRHIQLVSRRLAPQLASRAFVYCPLRAISAICPSILPYSFSLSAETPLGEFSLELILLQIVMPTLLEHATAFTVLKKAVVIWCRIVGGWLNLETYLLPAQSLTDEANPTENPQPEAEANANPQPPPPQQQAPAAGVVEDNLAARHHAFLMIREPANVETYEKPPYFPLRIIALLGCLAITAITISFLSFTIP
uniref:RING-type E3 ubiquitin transferase n=1 Tax=Acrobeloides nanus TaxID=290746 RepID=A0A914DC05_9BILA